MYKSISEFLSNLPTSFLGNVAHMDAAEPWQLSFQDPATNTLYHPLIDRSLQSLQKLGNFVLKKMVDFSLSSLIHL